MKKKMLLFMCILLLVSFLLIMYPFFAYHSYTEKKTTIDLPGNLKFDFFQFNLKLYEKTDEILTDHTTPLSDSFPALREYYFNEKTGEHLTKITNLSNGCFVKGYYTSPFCSCVYYDDSTMKLFGKKTGKVYCFKNSKLQYISEIKVCKRMFSSVYVITYFDPQAQRIAIETQTAYLNGNVKAVRFLYNRYYNQRFLPICKKRFDKMV